MTARRGVWARLFGLAPGTGGETSLVHPWMVREPASARAAVAGLDALLPRLDAALASARPAATRRLEEAQEAEVAAAAAGPGPSDPVADLRAALGLARDAFAGLADRMDEHVPPLRALLAELDDGPAAARRIRALKREVRLRTDALSAADTACRRSLEEAVRLVPGTATVAASGGWVAALTGTAARAARPGTTPERGALAALPAPEVASVLRHRPDLLASLAAADRLPGPDAEGAPAEVAGVLLEADRPGAARVAALAAAFAAAGEDAARRFALLWPAVVGPLDGAPLPLRIEANRLLVRVALGSARRTDVELEARAIARRAIDGSRWWRAGPAWALDAWSRRAGLASVLPLGADRPLALRADLRVRILLYQELLHDRAPDPDRPGGVAPRRLLLFDPRGRGRMAEVWGPLGRETTALGLLIPGTGTAVRGFHLPTGTARAVADADPARGTAVVAWMGADLPLTLATEAPRRRYAAAAAEPLVRHALGLRLGLPPGVPVTVLGHSYGGVVVGAAETLGLPADRVVHLASAGAGPGVRRVTDYAAVEPLGQPRDVRRFAMTAPGDPIRWVHRVHAFGLRVPLAWRRLLVRVPGWGGIDLGVEPTLLAGVTVVSAGVWEVPVGGHQVGEPVAGPAGHAGVTAPGTTAFRRIVEIVTAPAAAQNGPGDGRPAPDGTPGPGGGPP